MIANGARTSAETITIFLSTRTTKPIMTPSKVVNASDISPSIPNARPPEIIVPAATALKKPVPLPAAL